MKLRFTIALCVMIYPVLLFGQMDTGETEILQHKIEELTGVIEKLKAERNLSSDIDNVLRNHSNEFTYKDSLQLISLKKKQEKTRARIDELTFEVLQISQQLQDPRTRFALAKKMKNEQTKKLEPVEEILQMGAIEIDTISTQSIDIAALALMRKGMTRDQARLAIIDMLPVDQILNFYQNLSKEERYSLYDISDNITRSEGSKVTDARRSAIYFYLYTE